MLAMLTPASVLPLSKLSSSSFFFLSNVLCLGTLGEGVTGRRGVRNLEVETKDVVEEEVANPLDERL